MNLKNQVFVYQEWDIMKEQISSENKNEKLQNVTPIRPSFGIVLQEERIKKRMTTLDVANAVNSTAKLISMYENGTEVPSEEIELALKALFDIT